MSPVTHPVLLSMIAAAEESQAVRAEHERVNALVELLHERGMARIGQGDAKKFLGFAERHPTLVRAQVDIACEPVPSRYMESWAPAWWAELQRVLNPPSGTQWFMNAIRCARVNPEHREALLALARLVASVEPLGAGPRGFGDATINVVEVRATMRQFQRIHEAGADHLVCKEIRGRKRARIAATRT